MVVSDSLIDLVHFRCCLLLVVTHLTTGMARKERKKGLNKDRLTKNYLY